MVKDLLSEELPGDVIYSSNIGVEFVEIGHVVVFRGWDGIHGFELWRTNGTTEGTKRLVDLCPGECSSFPAEPRSMMGYVYFHATTPDLGNTIWRTDGTPEGTDLVVDISPGNGHFISSAFGAPFFAEFQDSIFFVADDGISGVELWRTDGQPGGQAELVADIWSGPESSYPTNLFVAGDTLFMAADDGIAGTELWKSDGTESGTFLLRDIHPGPGSSSPMDSPPGERSSSSAPRTVRRVGSSGCRAPPDRSLL